MYHYITFSFSLSDNSSATLIATDKGVKLAGNSQAAGLVWAIVDSIDLGMLLTLLSSSVLLEDSVDSMDLVMLFT